MFRQLADQAFVDHTIASHGHLLVSGASNGTNGSALPTPDVVGTLNSSGSNGSIALSRTTTLLTGDKAAILANPDVVDVVGYGTGNVYEGTAAAAAGGANSSISRVTAGADADQNNTDFKSLTPLDPCNSAGCPVTVPPDPAVDKTIAEIQGTGSASPLVDQAVTTQGVVTAAYKTGGFSGAFIQTDGTGGPVDQASHHASDGVFVFSSSFAAAVDKGDLVEVTGKVTEFGGMTELSTSTGQFEVLAGPAEGIDPTPMSFPLGSAAKESLEGMLLAPQGQFTITNNYATNQYAEIGLAPGTKPFDTPTNVVAPGAPAIAKQAQNDQDLVTLDDGASLNFLSAANQATPLPWLTPANQVRTGQAVTFDDPVVLDYRNSLWKLQPTEQLVAGADEPVDLGPGTRTDGPKDVGGEVKIGTFNVLNYFTTTAESYDAGPGACTYYNDRAGNHITANQCGDPATTSGNGPRGAANDASLARQQAKSVKAINALDADVVSLEEIENSVKFGTDRDSALSRLVGALNADAGSTKWAFVPSPADLPDPAGQDLIRTAFIYQPAVVDPVGASKILDTPAFANAREPLAQAFRPAGGAADSTFAVIVNHFKSKGSGTGADADQGDGQGASNASRVAQAGALVTFADDFADSTGTDKVFLSGDFNAYNKEDPVRVLEDAGYVNVPAQLTDKETYQFGGAVGSLDHVFASPKAFAKVTDADIWNINAYESVAREYSRYNYNVTDFYQPNPYRASDHDPEIVGFDASPAVTKVATTTDAHAPGSIRFGDALAIDASVTSSTGSAVTGQVAVSEGATQLDEETLVNGKATLEPGDLAIGTHSFTVSYAGDAGHEPSAATVVVTVRRSEAGITASTSPSSYGTSAVVHVTGAPGASGLVYVGNGDTVVGSGMMSNGTANVSIDKTLVPGSYELGVYYGGNASSEPASTTTALIVDRATTTIKKTGVSSKIVKNKTHARVAFAVTAPGYTVDGGKVLVYRGHRVIGSGTVRNGKVTVTLAKITSSGTKTLLASYSGDTYGKPSQVSFTMRVRRK